MSTTQVYETFIAAPPERVWAALTEPDLTRQYFFGTAVAIEPRPGGSIVYAAPDGSPVVDGEVIEAAAPRVLVTTWHICYDPEAAKELSEVTWRIEPRGAATKLIVTHDLAEAPASAKGVATDGWSLVLSGLKTLLETGKPLAIG